MSRHQRGSSSIEGRTCNQQKAEHMQAMRRLGMQSTEGSAGTRTASLFSSTDTVLKKAVHAVRS